MTTTWCDGSDVSPAGIKCGECNGCLKEKCEEWRQKAEGRLEAYNDLKGHNDELALQAHKLRTALGTIVREVDPADCGWGYKRVIDNTANPALAFTSTQAERRVAALEEVVRQANDNHTPRHERPCNVCDALKALRAAEKEA